MTESEDKLKKLLSLCKCSVTLTVNAHRDVYETAEQAIDDLEGRECAPEISEELRKKMVETNTIIDLHFYPDTPIGFYEIMDVDLDSALNRALEVFEK